MKTFRIKLDGDFMSRHYHTLGSARCGVSQAIKNWWGGEPPTPERFLIIEYDLIEVAVHPTKKEKA